jgi:hypothetical protein
MSKIAKLALVFAIAVVAMAAKQFIAPGEERVSPAELMRVAGPLPETKVEDLY